MVQWKLSLIFWKDSIKMTHFKNHSWQWHTISYPLRWLPSEKWKVSVGQGVEKLKFLCIASGDIKWCTCYGKVLGFNRITSDSAIPLLGIYPKELQAGLILVHQCSQQHSSQWSKGGSSPHVCQLMNGWPDVLWTQIEYYSATERIETYEIFSFLYKVSIKIKK